MAKCFLFAVELINKFTDSMVTTLIVCGYQLERDSDIHNRCETEIVVSTLIGIFRVNLCFQITVIYWGSLRIRFYSWVKSILICYVIVINTETILRTGKIKTFVWNWIVIPSHARLGIAYLVACLSVSHTKIFIFGRKIIIIETPP